METSTDLTAGANSVLKNNHQQKHSLSENKFEEFEQSRTMRSFIFGLVHINIRNCVCG